MANERQICCCGASSWTKIIAWLQIVGSFILIILNVFALAGLVSADPNKVDVDKNSLLVALAITLFVSVLGLTMSIVLLKGTNQKRIALLRAWLIYGIVAIIILISGLIVKIFSYSKSNSIDDTSVGSCIVLIAINSFCVTVVYIRMQEIREYLLT